jgi:conjugal transfer mating pair stabilization protein TraN
MRNIVVTITLFIFFWTHTLAFAAPHDEGIAAGNAANPVIHGTISQSSASAVVPGYTSTPPETAYYGQSHLAPATNAHLAVCALTPDDPVCQAQQGAMTSANVPKPALTAIDPGVASAKEIARNPSLEITNLASYYTGCLAPGACPNNVFCLGASCFNTSYTNDADFARSMSYMEAAREAGVYLDTERMRVFKGEQNNCRDRLLKNCCTTDNAGAGMTNQSMFGVGSRLVYDVLMNAGNQEFIYQGIQALLTSGGFSGSFTSYGVTVAVNGTALPAGSVALFSGDSMALAFDPWSLAITVVIGIAMSMMACNEEEGKLAMKEGAHLCHTIGKWCSSCVTILGSCVSCIEHTTSKCCFNSVLSRIVNEQGRVQVGKDWGDAEHPDCSGFTVAQLQSLDFAAMDLTEFYASIVPSMPDVTAIQSANAVRVAQIVAHPIATQPPGSTQDTPPSPLPGHIPTPGPNPTPAPTNPNVSPFGQNPALYTSTFSEEFEAGFNAALWNDAAWYENSNPTKNYAVENGVLKIWPQQDASGQFFNRTIDTDGKYYQTYGYFEIEAKLPYGQGTWPAFWLLNHDQPHPMRPEIDILEAYSGGGPDSGWSDGSLHPTAFASTVWPQGIEGGPAAGSKAYQNLGDLSAGFHKYAAKWEPDKITFYFDGMEFYSVNVSMSSPMYMLLDLWYGSASGAPDTSTPTGKNNAYEINYVRAWEFK